MYEEEATHEINVKENCFILLVDILGFSDFLKENSSQSEALLSDFYEKLNKISGPGEEKTKCQESSSETAIQHSLIFFSDTIIRIYPENYKTISSNPIIQTIYDEASDIQRDILKDLKLLSRGCLHHGEILKFKFGNTNIPTLYGRGLVEAYEEEKKCPYPRILITDQAYIKFNEKSSEETKITNFPMKNIPLKKGKIHLVQNLTGSLIKSDCYGRYFLPDFEAEMRKVLIEQYNAVKDKYFLENRELKKTIPKEKWFWLINEFNTCCERKSRSDLIINIG